MIELMKLGRLEIVLILMNRKDHLSTTTESLKLWFELNRLNRVILGITKQILPISPGRSLIFYLSDRRSISLSLSSCDIIWFLLLHDICICLLELLYFLLFKHLLVLELLFKFLSLSLDSLLLSCLFLTLFTSFFFLAPLLLLHLLLQNILKLLLLVLLPFFLVIIEGTYALVEWWLLWRPSLIIALVWI